MNFLKNSFNTVTNAVEINILKDKLRDLKKERIQITIEKNCNELQINQKEKMMPEISKLFTVSKDNLGVLDHMFSDQMDFNYDYEVFVQKYQNFPHFYLFKKLYDNLKKNNELVNDIMSYYNNNVKSNEYYDEKIHCIDEKIEVIEKKLNAVRVKQFGKKDNKSTSEVVVEEMS